MKRNHLLFLVLALGVAAFTIAPLAAQAFTIMPSGVYNYQNFGTAPNGASPPYWDNGSSDTFNGGSALNIGYWLLNTGDFSTNSNDNSPGVISTDAQYYGSAAGAADLNFYFKDGIADATFLYKLAGNTSNFGWYNVDKNGNPVDGSGASVPNPILQDIFTPGSINDNVTINVGDYFGLWAKDTNTSQTWYTQSKYNTGSDTNYQHFVVMRDKNLITDLYIGVEDLISNDSNADNDFNDKIIQMSGGSGGVVPLPGAVLLLGAGLARLVAYGRSKSS